MQLSSFASIAPIQSQPCNHPSIHRNHPIFHPVNASYFIDRSCQFMLVLNSSQHFSAAVTSSHSDGSCCGSGSSSSSRRSCRRNSSSRFSEQPLNPEPLNQNLPPNSNSLLKGRLIWGWIRGNVFLVLGGNLAKGGRDYSTNSTSHAPEPATTLVKPGFWKLELVQSTGYLRQQAVAGHRKNCKYRVKCTCTQACRHYPHLPLLDPPPRTLAKSDARVCKVDKSILRQQEVVGH